MKKNLLLVIAIISAFCSISAQRFMSYNIRHGEGLDDKIDLDRTIKVISAQKTKYIALQEIDSVTARANKVAQLNYLAEKLTMYPIFAKSIDFNGGKYGVGILSKEKPLNVKRIPMPNKYEDRVLLIAEFKDFYLACTHLSFSIGDHKASLDIVKNEIKNINKPFVIMGDWNEHPNDVFVKGLTETGFCFLSDTTQFTFPADIPNETIDYIAVYNPKGKVKGNSVKIKGNSNLLKVASDHRPLVARLKKR